MCRASNWSSQHPAKQRRNACCFHLGPHPARYSSKSVLEQKTQMPLVLIWFFFKSQSYKNICGRPNERWSPELCLDMLLGEFFFFFFKERREAFFTFSIRGRGDGEKNGNSKRVGMERIKVKGGAHFSTLYYSVSKFKHPFVKLAYLKKETKFNTDGFKDRTQVS